MGTFHVAVGTYNLALAYLGYDLLDGHAATLAAYPKAFISIYVVKLHNI
jgi:hypothetical protein